MRDAMLLRAEVRRISSSQCATDGSSSNGGLTADGAPMTLKCLWSAPEISDR